MLQCRPSARLLKEAPRPGPLVQFGKQQAHLHRAGTNRIKGRNVEGYKGCLPTHRPHVAGLALDLTKPQDRKSVVSGKSVSVRVDLGGRRYIKNNKNTKKQIYRDLSKSDKIT